MKIREEAEDEVRRALAAAAAAPWPEPADAYRDVQDTGSGQWR
jgi:pyruvate dehydrogenase E1 component alpha subunit